MKYVRETQGPGMFDVGQAYPVSYLTLFCPECGHQHIDEGEWATRIHKTHLCSACGNEWRVSYAPTFGVE